MSQKSPISKKHMLQNSESKKLKMEAKLQSWGCLCTEVEGLSITESGRMALPGEGLGWSPVDWVTLHAGLLAARICVHSACQGVHTGSLLCIVGLVSHGDDLHIPRSFSLGPAGQ